MLALEKKCPYCAELIKHEAIKCKHCSSFLDAVQEHTVRGQAPGRSNSKLEALVFVGILTIPFLIGGLLLAWFYSLPPGERARIERSAQ